MSLSSRLPVSALRSVAARRSLTTSLSVHVSHGDRRNPAAEDLSVAHQRDSRAGDTTALQKDAANLGRAPTAEEVSAAKEATVFANSLVGADHENEMYDVMPQEGVGEDVGAAGVVSGAPPELMGRRVRIYRPTPGTEQSAKATSHHWRIDWDTLPGSHRFENPLMGWGASADYMQGTHMKFASREDAIAFAERQGYPYFVQEPPEPRFKPKSYSNNYLYNPGPLRIVRTK